MICAYRSVVPTVHGSAWIADSAGVSGDAEPGDLDLIPRSAAGSISSAAEHRTARGV